MSDRIAVIDSHTGGEPTRVVIDGGPDLGGGDLASRLIKFRDSWDHFRTAVVTEPRGHDVLVGALLCAPHASDCVAGVIFFNNVGYLGMCGHGMIGVVMTLRHLGRIGAGTSRIDTPVGAVTVNVHQDHSVSIENVPSHRVAKDVVIKVDGIGEVVGDVAWGGNTFYLVRRPGIDFGTASTDELQHLASLIRRGVNDQGYPDVDHVELFSTSSSPNYDSRNFVLCPGDQYDRSPCGTGTSAKLACLAADGLLQPGQRWRQAGVLGTVFDASFEWADEAKTSIVPTITGNSYITGETTLLLDPADPFRHGF